MSDEAANAILEPAATRVRDPLTGRSLWLAGMIRDAEMTDDRIAFTLQTTRQHSQEQRDRLKDALVRNIERVGWKGEVVCNLSVSGGAAAPPAHDHSHGHSHSHNHGPAAKAKAAPAPVKGMEGGGMQPHGGPIQKQRLPGVKHILAVASGKGGVGKSTVAVNLAIALRRLGLDVGIMDADIYGPSIPMMLGVKGKPFANDDKKIIPLESYGVKLMSIGFLVDDKEPVIWRGPMVMGVVRQFLQDVYWNPLDVLVIDLPPGTGDAQLTLIQAVDLSGSVIVTTPQDVAVLDAVRGIEMFRKLDVPVFGIVENMSWFKLPDGSKVHPFGEGGGARTASQYDVPLLAQVPLDPDVREGGDSGRPIAYEDHDVADIFDELAASVATRLGLGA